MIAAATMISNLEVRKSFNDCSIFSTTDIRDDRLFSPTTDDCRLLEDVIEIVSQPPPLPLPLVPMTTSARPLHPTSSSSLEYDNVSVSMPSNEVDIDDDDDADDVKEDVEHDDKALLLLLRRCRCCLLSVRVSAAAAAACAMVGEVFSDQFFFDVLFAMRKTCDSSFIREDS
jgi:hypothetical protein